MKHLLVILLVLLCISPAFARYEAVPNVEQSIAVQEPPDLTLILAATWWMEDAFDAGKGAAWRWLYGPRAPPK